jgi:small subunit ribosomal protein S21
MAKVVVSNSDSFEAALSKFKKQVAKDGILKECKVRSHFENNRERGIRKVAAAKKRGRK